MAEVIERVMVTPPKEARAIARQALEILAKKPKWRRFGTQVAIKRAESIVRGEPQIARDITDWFTRRIVRIVEAQERFSVGEIVESPIELQPTAAAMDAERVLGCAGLWGGRPMYVAVQTALDRPIEWGE